jgi:uncharacterized protein (DUF58 family)
MPVPDVSQPARGAYVDLATLIALRFPAQQIDVRRRRRALSQMSGGNRANARGRGIDFDEVRRYQAGDDIRAIDWRVTARTGSAHTRLYHEERERPVIVAIDQRAAMFFGSRFCFKSVLAAHLGALVTWSALAAGERVGGLVFNDSSHRDVRPRRSRKAALGLLSTLVDFNTALSRPAPASAEGFTDILANCRRIARPGSSLVLISDFQGLQHQRAQEHLFQLSQHVEITAFHCSDALEYRLPPAGDYAVTDGTRISTLATAGEALRRRYSSAAEAEREAVLDSLRRLRVPCQTVSTQDAPYAVLSRLYGRQAA